MRDDDMIRLDVETDAATPAEQADYYKGKWMESIARNRKYRKALELIREQDCLCAEIAADALRETIH